MVEGRLYSGAVLDFQKCPDVRVADTHVSAGICDIPEVADGVLKRLFLEFGSARSGVEGLDLGFELVLGRLDLLACLFVLRPVGCLVITAAVEDYIAANAARQACFGFADAALRVQGHLHRRPVFPESVISLHGGDTIHARCSCVCCDHLSLMDANRWKANLGSFRARSKRRSVELQVFSLPR
jgi:hypothetical protein